MFGERLTPCVGHSGSGGVEAGGEVVQMLSHGLRDGVAHGGGFAGEAGHGGVHSWLDCRAGGPGAVRDAFLQRLPHGIGQQRVGRFGSRMEGILTGRQPLAEGFVLAGHRRGHGFQPIHQRGHQFGLALQQGEDRVVLVMARMRAQRGGDALVQHLRRLHALAAGKRRKQPEHGRGGYASHRRPEGEAKTLDRGCQRGADRLQVGGAFQCDASAA